MLNAPFTGARMRATVSPPIIQAPKKEKPSSFTSSAARGSFRPSALMCFSRPSRSRHHLSNCRAKYHNVHQKMHASHQPGAEDRKAATACSVGCTLLHCVLQQALQVVPHSMHCVEHTSKSKIEKQADSFVVAPRMALIAAACKL